MRPNLQVHRSVHETVSPLPSDSGSYSKLSTQQPISFLSENSSYIWSNNVLKWKLHFPASFEVGLGPEMWVTVSRLRKHWSVPQCPFCFLLDWNMNVIAEVVVATLYEPNVRPYMKDGKSQRQKGIGTARMSPLGPTRVRCCPNGNGEGEG